MMSIEEKNQKIILTWKHRITKKTVIRKNPGKTENTFYQSVFPESLKNYMQVQNRDLYFYREKNNIMVTSRPPTYMVEYSNIKLQKNNIFSIPRKLFKVTGEQFVVFRLDFSRRDLFWSGVGAVTVELV